MFPTESTTTTSNGHRHGAGLPDVSGVLTLVAMTALTALVATSTACPSEIANPGECAGPSCVKDPVNTEPPRLFVDPPFGLGFDCVSRVEINLVTRGQGL